MDWIQRVKSAVGLSSTPLSESEKRQTYRVGRRIGVTATRWNGETLNMMVTDVGPTGLRVESSIPLKTDEKLTLVLPKKRVDVDNEPEFLVKVVWSRKRRDYPVYQSGVTFVLDTPKHKAAAAAFLIEDCKLGVLNPKERRKSPRSISNLEGEFAIDGDSFEVRVRNISVKGALLLGTRSLSQGTVGTIKISLPGKKVPPLECRAEVVRPSIIDEETGLHQLAVYFSRIPPEVQDAFNKYLSTVMSDSAKMGTSAPPPPV